MNQMSGSHGRTFTDKLGQYLAYIHLYTRLHRRPPAETDMQQYSASAHHLFIRWW
jgi:hypothetical protein